MFKYHQEGGLVLVSLEGRQVEVLLLKARQVFISTTREGIVWIWPAFLQHSAHE